MKVKISVMITSFNCEDCIDEAIKSVVIQDMPFRWELLVGDDGSSDNTVQRIKKWIAEFPNNIKLYEMKREQNEEKDGTRAAKNRANLLEKAVGKYLIFLDGDDQFLGTQKLRKQVEILEDSRYQNCSCVAHNILANDIANNKKYPLTDENFPEGPVDIKKYWEEMYFHTNTILFRQCCKDLMLKEEHKDYLNDNFITYIILQYGQIYYLKELWGQYNITGDGLWTGKKRIYGCFRNLILYDLEIHINPDMKHMSFIRHLYDFRYIFSNYSKEDKNTIYPLIKALPKESFYYTFLLYRLRDELEGKQKIEKLALHIKVNLVFALKIISKIFHKICQK